MYNTWSFASHPKFSILLWMRFIARVYNFCNYIPIFQVIKGTTHLFLKNSVVGTYFALLTRNKAVGKKLYTVVIISQVLQILDMENCRQKEL